MIKEKDVEKCRFFTTTGGDIWRTKKVRAITEIDLVNCETSRIETCRIGEQSAEKFIAIAIPRIKRTEDGRRKTEGRGQKTHASQRSPASQSSKGKRQGRPPKKRPAAVSSRKDKKTSSQYLGVTIHQGKKRPRYYAQVSRGGKWKGLGVYNVEELAAAAVQEHLGNKDEAARLRKMAEQKTDTAIDEIKGNVGQVKFLCAGCGADYEQKPKQCVKCGTGAFEMIQPDAKRKGLDAEDREDNKCGSD